MIGFPFKQILSRSRAVQVYRPSGRLKRFLPFALTGAVCAIAIYPLAYEYGLNARQKEIDDLIYQQERDFNKFGAQMTSEVAQAITRAETAEKIRDHMWSGLEKLKTHIPKIDESQFKCAGGYQWLNHYVLKKEKIGLGFQVEDKKIDLPFEYIKCVKISELNNESN